MINTVPKPTERDRKLAEQSASLLIAMPQLVELIAAVRKEERDYWLAQLRSLPENLKRAMCKGWVPGPQEAATFIADWLS